MYSWGRGTFGRLGNGSESDENLPVSIKLDNGKLSQTEKPHNFIGVAAGAYHSLALSGNCYYLLFYNSQFYYMFVVNSNVNVVCV